MSRVLIACALALCASAAFAQDKKPEPKGEPVMGKVTYKGQPLAGGTITFVSKDGKAKVAATITEDGTYKATVPAGEYAVAISTEVLKKKADPKDPPKPLPKIPAKYGDPQTSGLTVVVKEGKNEITIELK
jgi:hypothetical protein